MWPTFSRFLPSALLLLLLFSNHLVFVTALRFTFPSTEGTTLNLFEPNITITWETEPTDAATTTGRILLARTDVAPPQPIVVTARVELARGAFRLHRELPLSVETGGKYRFEIWPLPEGITAVALATSVEFAVEDGRPEGSSGVLSSGTSTSSSTRLASAVSTATTSSQTVSTASTQSQTPRPSQGTGNSLGGFAAGAFAGMGFGVPVGALIFAVAAFFFF